MRRLVALAWKDVAQHGITALALFSFLPLAWGLLVLSVLARPATVTYFEAHLWFCRIFLPLAGLALGSRLVVAEYHGRTQLYLEALPIGRYDVLIVKWALGAATLLGIALASLLSTAVIAIQREPVDPAFLALMGARTALFAAALWSFFFAMGFLGRLRIPVYLALGVALTVIVQTTALELWRFGPFAMVAEDLPLERSRWPLGDMLESAGVALAWIALAVVLATVREGSLAETLARPMSQREKVAIGIAVVAILVAWGKLDPPNAREPYDFPEHRVVRSSIAPIEVFHAEDALRPDAEALLARLERDLPPLAPALGWDALPPVHVMYSDRLDADTIENVAVGEDDGVAIRANFARSPEFDEDWLVGELAGRAIDAHTKGRSYWEPYGWIRDGVSEWWPHREGALPRSTVLRALFATRARGIDRDRLARWDLFREREGWEASEALAATGIAALVESRGRDAALSLARDLFEDEPSEDSRPVIAAWLRPVPARIRDRTGIEESALVAAWRAWLEARRADAPPELARLARAEATIAVEPGEEGLRDLVARVRASEPLPEGTTVSLQHLALGPFEHDVWPWEPTPDDRAWPAGARELEIRVPGRYGPGGRVWAVVDVRLPDAVGVSAPLRVAYARLEVR